MGNDVIRMQQEAEQRVARMRERSRMLINGDLPERGRSEETMAAGRPAPYSRRSFPVSTPVPPPPPAPAAAGRPGGHSPDGGCMEKVEKLEKPEKANGLGGLFQDQEQLLLLLLAFLLIKNGAQIELIVALLYLAM